MTMIDYIPMAYLTYIRRFNLFPMPTNSIFSFDKTLLTAPSSSMKLQFYLSFCYNGLRSFAKTIS